MPGGTTSYGYDALRRLTSVNGTTFEYDALGLLTYEHLSNSVTTSYGYDDLNRLTNITQQLGNTLIGSYVYTLDDAGSRLNVSEMGGQSIQWTYDDLYRLKSETQKNGTTIVAQSSFTYVRLAKRLPCHQGSLGLVKRIRFSIGQWQLKACQEAGSVR